MKMSILEKCDISPLENILVHNGKIVAASYEELKNFPQETLSTFCHRYGIYQIPTTELIEFLNSEIPNKNNTIEIGAGNGCIGRNLGVRMTDNKSQLWPKVRILYDLHDQPIVNYGDDVEEIGANEAVKKHKPKTVVASWVTELFKNGIHKDRISKASIYGIDEQKMFRDGITKYIHIGNESVHSEKRILQTRSHRKLKFPWLLSRSLEKNQNVIYVFESNK